MTVGSLAADLIDGAAEARKALTTLLGVAAIVTELGLLHGQAEVWAGVATAAATVALTYLAPNGPIVTGLRKLKDEDMGAGTLDDSDDELSEPTSKPALDPAPLVTGTAAPRPMPGKHEA